MEEQCRAVFEIEDKIYRLAFLMTGSKILARELVLLTYRDAGACTTLNELFKRFRARYFSNFSIDFLSCFMATGCKREYGLQDDSSGHYYEDIKLAVLFADMFDLTYQEIAEINGTDPDTMKLWLWWGRKNFFMKISKNSEEGMCAQ
jgi:hypothetical protein